MAALDFDLTHQEDKFLQLMGFDRFITRITWYIINMSIVHEVISNLNFDTMKSVLNGQGFPIFHKDWRNKMKASFYITTFTAKINLTLQRSELRTSFQLTMKRCARTCRIANYAILEAKRLLRFFEFLFLLRTTANTIHCSVIVHFADALNNKLANIVWREFSS